MERLTTYISGYAHGKQGRTIALAEKSKDFCRGKFEATGIVDRLAAYEDTGLTPEQCAEYAKAEREGRLVVLPCKVGEYWARDGKRYIVAEISVTSAWGIMVRHYEEGNGEMLSCNPQYFAKHYTRAEAEAAMKGVDTDERNKIPRKASR